MTIETKYSKNDKVWLLDNNRLYQGSIKEITVHVSSVVVIKYEVQIGNSTGTWIVERNEERLFQTKQELFDSL